MHIQKLLVPVDFSPPSRIAVNYGIALARKFRARLTLLHVIQTPAVTVYTFPVESMWIEKEHREQAVRMMSALVAPEDQDDLDLRILVKTGSIEDEIAKAIEDEGANLVVMGAHGRGLFGRWLIGSVTQHMLRKIKVPVLTVHRVARPLTMDRIMFATDLSDAAARGFHAVVQLARTAQSGLILVHAIDTHSHALEGVEVGVDFQQLMEQARDRLKALAAEAAREKVKTEIILAEGRVAEAIFKAAEASSADIIAIAVEKKGLIERTLLGAFGERVVRESHLPVLSIPVDMKS